MDLVDDFVKTAKQNQAVLIKNKLGNCWGFRFPCAQSIGFHVITHGHCWLNIANQDSPIELCSGDMVLLARGVDHELMSDVDASSVQVEERDLTELGRHTFRAQEESDEQSDTFWVTGVYHFKHKLLHPLLNDMPDYYKVSAKDLADKHPLLIALALLDAEVTIEKEPTNPTVVQSLMTMLFYYLMKQLNEEKPKSLGQILSRQWSKAYTDKYLSHVFEEVHQNLAFNWTVESMAKRSGLSRSAFATRFKALTGDTPIHYLAQARVQKSIEYLKLNDHDIEAVSSLVGYSSAFAFSKAFKRICGISPNQYRKALG